MPNQKQEARLNIKTPHTYHVGTTHVVSWILEQRKMTIFNTNGKMLHMLQRNEDKILLEDQGVYTEYLARIVTKESNINNRFINIFEHRFIKVTRHNIFRGKITS